jgi:16S rRNA (cytosine1402-N4)-methyltransferase
MGTIHKPVLLKETIENLNIREDDIVLDGTINGGGHSTVICEKLGENGMVVGIDQDSDALERARKRLQKCKCKIALRMENFRNLDKVLKEIGVERIDKALFDLGLSSDQLEESGRGFSFQKDEPLIMTFNPDPKETDITAHEIVNKWKEESIADIIYGYGEEKFARKIAKGIVLAREENPIEKTVDLVKIIRNSVPGWYKRKKTNCATKTFQALRIAVNDEMLSTKEGVEKAIEYLNPGGRIAVISFHSIEDRLIKILFKEKQKKGVCAIITKKPIQPSKEELKENPRARSAKLRVCEKL